MKVKRELGEVGYDEGLGVVKDGIPVSTQRQKNEKVRCARHGTEVFSLWKQSK